MNTRTFAVTILAALLAVLTLASSAWAACAWVLWEERFTVAKSGDSKEWGVLGTALEAKNCQTFSNRAMEDRAQQWRGPLTEVKVEGNQVTVVSKAGFVNNFRYFCLPDTVDPRAPKASGR